MPLSPVLTSALTRFAGNVSTPVSVCPERVRDKPVPFYGIGCGDSILEALWWLRHRLSGQTEVLW